MRAAKSERSAIARDAGLDDADPTAADLTACGAAIDFRIRLSTNGPRVAAEHVHANVQMSIPFGSTIASGWTAAAVAAPRRLRFLRRIRTV